MLQGGQGPAGTPGVSGRRGAIGPKVCGLVFLAYLSRVEVSLRRSGLCPQGQSGDPGEQGVPGPQGPRGLPVGTSHTLPANVALTLLMLTLGIFRVRMEETGTAQWGRWA